MTHAARAEEPAIAIQLGLSRNPLRWAFAMVRLLAFCFMFWIAWMLFQMEACSGAIGLLVVWIFFARFLVDTFAIDRSSYRFYGDRIEVDSRPAKWSANRTQRTHGYDEIGHIELTSPKLVKIFFATVHGRATVAEIPMDSRLGEDIFDELVDHLESVAPEHLYSIYEHGHVRFSRECSFAELFPDHVAAIDRVRVHGRTIYAGEQAYSHDLPDVYVTSGDRKEPLLRVTRSHVLSNKSVVLAAVRLEQYREVRIEFFDENEYSIDGVNGRVLLDGEVVGKCEEDAGVTRVEFLRPCPTIVALIMTMAFAANRAALRV